MKIERRSVNTMVKCWQSSSQTYLIEMTEIQRKVFIDSMKKLTHVKVKKMIAMSDIAKRKLTYFKVKDKQISFI